MRVAYKRDGIKLRNRSFPYLKSQFATSSFLFSLFPVCFVVAICDRKMIYSLAILVHKTKNALR